MQTLHRFPWGTTPYNPTGIVAAPDGSVLVVGDTSFGSIRLTPAGAWTTVMTSPLANIDGAGPVGPLVPDGDGFLYGAARYSGAPERGTLFSGVERRRPIPGALHLYRRE